MMTKQAELKKCAYASNLKSRALSILIYLIDRSNRELTCFPAIPTMAAELHIGISTVKRALHELVDAGFIQKEARFRENNRGQSSNLYTLVFKEETPMPKPEYNPIHGENIDSQTTPTSSVKIEHIAFEDIVGTAKAPMQPQTAQQGQVATKPAREKKTIRQSQSPVHLLLFDKLEQMRTHNVQREMQDNFYPAHNFMWTGVESSLIPP